VLRAPFQAELLIGAAIALALQMKGHVLEVVSRDTDCDRVAGRSPEYHRIEIAFFVVDDFLETHPPPESRCCRVAMPARASAVAAASAPSLFLATIQVPSSITALCRVFGACCCRNEAASPGRRPLAGGARL
jgi:hypothetical protein